jgi:hypothetical protein
MSTSSPVAHCDRFKARCGFCQEDITCNDGLNLKWDSIWMTNLGCWLCHYCYVGYKEGNK